MKNRKGFGKIDIDGKKFLFNWANNPDGPMLVMYDEKDSKIEIPYRIWERYSESDEYCKRKIGVSHGKYKTGPEFGAWGKREAREMYFKYLKNLSWQQGWDAYYQDTGMKCPYPPDSELELYWLGGYSEAADAYSRSFDL